MAITIEARDVIHFTDQVSVVVDDFPVDELVKENNAVSLEPMDDEAVLIEGLYGDLLGVVSNVRKYTLTMRVKPSSRFLRDQWPNIAKKRVKVQILDKNESTYVKWISDFALRAREATTERGGPELNGVERRLIGSFSRTE